jgi:hypothetical protein
MGFIEAYIFACVLLTPVAAYYMYKMLKRYTEEVE